MASLFFYGTLCHAGVLTRVIGNEGTHLTMRDAVLLDHARLHVEGEDYPAVIAAQDGEKVMGRSLSEDEGRVRGVLVTGLTDGDVRLLDEFEGDEYTRSPCTVSPLSPGSSTPSSSTVSATVYLWTAPHSRLSPKLWTFEAFMRDSAHRWVGAGSATNPDFAEVDRRRAMGGVITPRGVQAEANKVEEELQAGELDARLEEAGGTQSEEFGKKLGEKYWSFKEGWTNLNHGAYGAPPKPVVSAMREVQDTINGAPDEFMKWTYEPQLIKLRERLADFVEAEADDVVIVGNTTVGVNTILKSLTTEWQKGDRLLYISTSIYNACAANLQFIVDSHPHLSLSLLPVPIVYPLSHADLVATVRRTIEEAENDGTGRKIRLALVDAISSVPAVVVPWPELCELFREKQIMSLVDAAHEIGQQPVSLKSSKPDFWVSNAHKWLYAHRAVALLYVDKRYQHLIHSTPIGHAYRSSSLPASSASAAPPPRSWTTEFVWHSTVDWSPIMSTHAALDFRRDVLGGEERIRGYCHRLAKEGGEKVARILGTRVLKNKEGEGELVASMVNVELPLPAQTSFSPEEQAKISKWWIGELVNTHKTHVPIFAHNSVFHVRLSAQVYNELCDFEFIGGVLKSLCERIGRKEYDQ
ncbi:hypothetical protein JCM6882_002172 [Rhodosporidiobolus microsporus]